MKKKILLVEDDKTIASLLVMELEDAGFETVHAKDGVSALEQLKNQKFDGLISDLVMPNMDGLQLVDAILAMSIAINTVIISGSVNAEVDLKLKKRGIKHIFLKPLSDEQFDTLFTILRSG